MRLLIFGAGMLGSFYAVKLLAAGHGVTILARGRRAAQLGEDGLVVQEYGRNRLRAPVSVIESLDPESSCEYVLVLVRNDQVESVLPALAANKATPSLVFMFNNLGGPLRLIDVLGHDRVVLGFLGAAGERAAGRRQRRGTGAAGADPEDDDPARLMAALGRGFRRSPLH